MKIYRVVQPGDQFVLLYCEHIKFIILSLYLVKHRSFLDGPFHAVLPKLLFIILHLVLFHGPFVRLHLRGFISVEFHHLCPYILEMLQVGLFLDPHFIGSLHLVVLNLFLALKKSLSFEGLLFLHGFSLNCQSLLLLISVDESPVCLSFLLVPVFL